MVLINAQTKTEKCNETFKFIGQMLTHQLECVLSGVCPVEKLAEGKYLIGTKVKEAMLMDGRVFVKSGSSIKAFQSYVQQHSRAECLKLDCLMAEGNGYCEAVSQLVNQLSIEFAMQPDSDAFRELMREYRSRLAQREAQKKHLR
jgi:hypothetical protein